MCGASNSSGSVPMSGLIPTQPQSSTTEISRISICSTSPGRAPSTKTGPVMRCVLGPGSHSLSARRCPSLTSERSGGSRASFEAAQLVSATVSPEATRRTGRTAASR